MSHLACKPHNFQASSDADVKLECPYCIIDDLTAENERLRAALEEIAKDEDCYGLRFTTSRVANIAIKALEGK